MKKINDPYLLWIQELNNRIFNLQEKNKENIYWYGIANEKDIESFTKLMQENEVKMLTNFTEEEDTLSVISTFKAKFEASSKVNIFWRSVSNYFTEYRRSNNCDYFSSGFEKILIQESPLKVPDKIHIYSQEKKTINNERYFITIVYLNKQDLINFNIHGKYYSRYISEKEIEFLNTAEILYNKILYKKEN